jgi:hypothetical protein
VACPAPLNGSASCVDGVCGSSCDADHVLCSTGSCAPLRTYFDSGTLEGWTLHVSNSEASSGPLTPTTFQGLTVLRGDMEVADENRGLEFRLDVCGGSPLDLRGKSVVANVRLAGPALPASGGAHSISMHVWTSAASYFIADVPQPAANTWYTIRGTLEDANTQNLIGVGIYIYVNGSGGASPWTGSAYLDDVRFE